MAPPPVILKPEATLLSHTRPNAGLNCPRASKPLGVYRTLMTGSATSPIHPTEGAILLESGRESLKRNNYPAYLNAITRSLYSE